MPVVYQPLPFVWAPPLPPANMWVKDDDYHGGSERAESTDEEQDKVEVTMLSLHRTRAEKELQDSFVEEEEDEEPVKARTKIVIPTRIDRMASREESRAWRANKKIMVFSIGEHTQFHGNTMVVPWNHRKKSLKEMLMEDYKLPHINTTIKVYGISRHGCAPACHPGENVNNLQAVSQDRTFRSKIRPLCNATNEWFHSRDSRPFVCAFACKEGRHRSVAAAKLWAEICKRSGFWVVGPHHLCNWNWWGCDGTCPECHPLLPSKQALFDVLYCKLGEDCPW